MARRKYKTLPTLYTAKMAAARCEISSQSLRRYARLKLIGFYRLPYGEGKNEKFDEYFFTPEDVRRFKLSLPPIPQSKR